MKSDFLKLNFLYLYRRIAECDQFLFSWRKSSIKYPLFHVFFNKDI